MATPNPASDADDDLESDEQRAVEQIRMLKVLCDMSMALAQALHGPAMAAAQASAQVSVQAETEAEPNARPSATERAGQAVTAFDRAARSVRQTVALESRVRRELAALRAGTAPAREPQFEGRTREEWAAAQQGLRIAWRRAAVLDALEPAIASEVAEAGREQTLAELDEQLEAMAESSNFIRQHPQALIAQIRHELGLPPATAEDGAGDGEDWRANAQRSWIRRASRSGP